MQLTIKSALIHFGTAIAFAVMFAALTDLTTLLPINIGWHFLTVLYVLIMLGQIAFYYLTTYTNIWLTILSFILNFILWVAEQVNLERFFHDTFFYQDNNFRYAIIILGGLLWAINKLIIDRLFILKKFNLSLTNRAEKLWTGKQTT
jgi:hypothetical protein